MYFYSLWWAFCASHHISSSHGMQGLSALFLCISVYPDGQVVTWLQVDRIETDIQRINPGIRYVDLETDRGQTSQWPRALRPSTPAGAW